MKKKNTWINYLFVAIVVGIIIYAGVSSQETAFLSGVGALSISNVQLLDGFDKLRDGQVWLMTVSPSQLNQRFHVDQLTPSESEQSDGTKTEKTATIEVDLDNQQCVYPLSTDSTATKIQKYEIYEWSNYRCGTSLGTQSYYNEVFTSAKKLSSSKIVYYGTFTPTFASDTCYVIYKSAETEVTKQLESSYVRVIGSIILEAEGEDSVSFELDTEDSISTATTSDTLTMGKSGYLDDVAYVEWRGNLLNKNCEGLVNYRGAYYNNEWRIISTEYYDSYKNQKTAFENDMLTGEDYLEDEDETEEVLEYYNTFWTNAISSRSITNGNIESKTSTSGAKLRVEHTDLLQSPVLSLYVVGDYLGIENRMAEGQIVSASDVEFDANEEASITVKVKNTGDYDSSYTLKADCTSPFQSESKDIGIEAGDTETEYLLISTGGISSTTTKTCTVGLYSAGTLLDTEKITATANPVATCELDEFCSKVGSNDVVYACTGGSLYIKDTCTSVESCVETSTTAQCVAIGDIKTDCESSYFSFLTDASSCGFCDSKFSTTSLFAFQCASFNAKDYFPYLFFLLGGLLTYFIIAMKYKPKKELKVIAVILSLVVGFILFLISDIIVSHWIISGIIATILLIIAYFTWKVGRFIP